MVTSGVVCGSRLLHADRPATLQSGSLPGDGQWSRPGLFAGSRLLHTDRPATSQSGSPPGDGRCGLTDLSQALTALTIGQNEDPYVSGPIVDPSSIGRSRFRGVFSRGLPID
jgi:hypothetical protein